MFLTGRPGLSGGQWKKNVRNRGGLESIVKVQAPHHRHPHPKLVPTVASGSRRNKQGGVGCFKRRNALFEGETELGNVEVYQTEFSLIKIGVLFWSEKKDLVGGDNWGVGKRRS